MYKGKLWTLHKFNIFKHIHFIAFATKMAAMVDDWLSTLITSLKRLAILGVFSTKFNCIGDAPVQCNEMAILSFPF